MEKKSYEFFTLKTFTDPRGALTPIEVKDFVPWEAKRVYYCTDVKATRGGHCHLIENEFFVCIQGSMLTRLHDGKEWIEKRLYGPGDAVRVDHHCWHEFIDFEDNGILLALSSVNYNPEDYIHDFDEFLKLF